MMISTENNTFQNVFEHMENVIFNWVGQLPKMVFQFIKWKNYIFVKLISLELLGKKEN